MAIITADKITFATTDNGVAFRIPVDGRDRTFVLSPTDAMRMANMLATLAMEFSTLTVPKVERVEDIRLKPYEAGDALLLITSLETGPLQFRLNATWLGALTQAAAAALELAEPGGSA